MPFLFLICLSHALIYITISTRTAPARNDNDETASSGRDDRRLQLLAIIARTEYDIIRDKKISQHESTTYKSFVMFRWYRQREITVYVISESRVYRKFRE